jgi:hypothetical protein
VEGDEQHFTMTCTFTTTGFERIAPQQDEIHENMS